MPFQSTKLKIFPPAQRLRRLDLRAFDTCPLPLKNPRSAAGVQFAIRYTVIRNYTERKWLAGHVADVV